ncbi:kinase-like domain-containing protein [Rhizophagus clarus]|uniref:Kinase-like domain-containing protein n=1 Tax=Rhizophagus clarus TaxID=94130 RepID=A0A8H3QEP7_9GLOM|nr:kinase-like domain-containing protein [Rhizophagus clarus]
MKEQAANKVDDNKSRVRYIVKYYQKREAFDIESWMLKILKMVTSKGGFDSDKDNVKIITNYSAPEIIKADENGTEIK